MGGRGRWDYMTLPGYNPPSDACPWCEELSKVNFIGARTVTRDDGTRAKITRYQCEHGHEWAEEEERPS